MKNKILFLTLIIVSLLACSKDETEGCTKAQVRFTCISNNPYSLYIDGVYKTQVNGNSFVNYYLSEGNHTYKAEQVSGYILYPTVRNTTAYVTGCVDSEWIFP